MSAVVRRLNLLISGKKFFEVKIYSWQMFLQSFLFNVYHLCCVPFFFPPQTGFLLFSTHLVQDLGLLAAHGKEINSVESVKHEPSE